MNKTRVLLLYSSEVQSSVVAGYLRVAPIGLFFINSYLKKQGYETKIVHLDINQFNTSMPFAKYYKMGLRQEIKQFDPHYIGYSFRNLFHWGSMPKNWRKLINHLSISLEKHTINFLRRSTRAPIIGGGPAFMLAPKLYMDYLGLDYGIIGEGELAFEKLLTHLRAGGKIEKLPGLVYRKNDVILSNPHQHIKDLTAMPIMNVSDIEGYRELYYDNGGYGSIQTKRGCGFRCIYCHYPYLEGNKYRLRDPATVVEEIIDIKEKYDINHFFFVDSVFSTPSSHSQKICEELISRGADIKWAAHTNPRGITRKLLEIYRESGCHNVIFTPDTLSEKTLKSYQKDFSVDEVKKAVLLLKKVGIPFEVSLILGGPGEDEETVNETVAFCDEYLQEIPILFFSGMWLHSSAPAMQTAISEGIFPDRESMEFDKIVLANDFEANRKLNYFFPHVKKRRGAFLNRIYKKIRKYKRVIIEKDIVVDWTTGTVKHAPELNVIENQRPWHNGMKGRI
jgi:radical SAM superfamily enzyme YgiQ (UPF0313 family)